MKKYTLHPGFTLVELVVAITIFSVMMVGVFSIFLFASQMSTRVELNRLMQENVKNVFENIAEEIRKGDIIAAVGDLCPSSFTLDASLNAKNKLCLGGGIEYFIGNKLGDNWVRVTDVSQCANFVKVDGVENDENICRVLKNDGINIFPLTNSFVAVEDLRFVISNEDLPKVSIHMTLRPAVRKGLAAGLLERNRMFVQTSISERFIATQ